MGGANFLSPTLMAAPSADPVAEEQAVRAWVVEQGFEEGDLRSDRWIEAIEEEVTPMGNACFEGELNVCKWLFDHGAADDITVEHGTDHSPMQLACSRGHLAVCQWLVKMGAAEDITKCDDVGTTPMETACRCGHLSVCEWLFKMGAAEHISKAAMDGWTPMLSACGGGYLSVCEWLYKVGAAEDISRANDHGDTPMFRACSGGHLPVCEWLYKVGADGDISRANNQGSTPMLVASHFDQLHSCEWLVLNGALNRPTSFTAAAAEDEDGSDQGGHVDPAIVERDTRWGNPRPALLKWAKRVLAIHRTFFHVVLHGSVILPASQRGADNKVLRCPLPRLFRSDHLIMRCVGSFLGVQTGRRLRNVREFAEALVALCPWLGGLGEEEKEGFFAWFINSSTRGSRRPQERHVETGLCLLQ